MTTQIFIKIGYACISIAVMVAYGLLTGGVMARIRARAYGRYGAPVWQPFLDIFKNMNKRTAISHGMMFYLGPIFRFAGGLGTYLFIPAVFGSVLFANFSGAGDIFLVMYFIFFGQLGMALGAGEGGHPYSGIAISRGLAQMSAFEVPFALAVISIIIQYDTFSITEIVAAQQGGFLQWTMFTNPLATISAFIALLGMNMQSPFDIVIAPQEIPIGPPTEFPSQFLSMLQTNRGLFLAAKLILFMNLFYGGATSIWILFLKIFVIYLANLFVSVSFPRYRAEQAIKFFLKYPTIIGILSIIVMAMK